MIHLEEDEDIFKTVFDTFLGDSDLAHRFHYVSPSDFRKEECAEFTTSYILNVTPKTSKFYSINKSGEKIGFCCIDGDAVWDFAIKKAHRSDELLTDTWEVIRNVTGGVFMIRLYECNFREINWLLKNKKAVPVSLDKVPRSIWYWNGLKDGIRQEQTFYTPLSQILLKFEL